MQTLFLRARRAALSLGLLALLGGCALPPPSPPADPDAAWRQEVGWPPAPAPEASAPRTGR